MLAAADKFYLIGIALFFLKFSFRSSKASCEATTAIQGRSISTAIQVD